MRIAVILAVSLTLMTSAASAEAPPVSNRVFPAKVDVASSRPIGDGDVELEVHFLIDKDVVIYANPVGDAMSRDSELKVSVIGANDEAVAADITYPKPSGTVDVFDGIKLNVLSGKATVLVRIQSTAKEKAKIRFDFAGTYKGVACIGRRRIETDIP